MFNLEFMTTIKNFMGLQFVLKLTEDFFSLLINKKYLLKYSLFNTSKLEPYF